MVEPESTQCPCGCSEMVRIGEDRTERLDIVPAQLRVIVTVRPKYACRMCEQGVTQAPAPAHLIEGGLPTEGAIAHVLVSKYSEHLPLYRQAQIYTRSGLDLHRSTLAGWVGKASFHLCPVVERLAEHLKQSGKLFMDETRAPVLDPGRGRTKTGWLWALARDDRNWGGPDPPGVVYFYAPGRGGAHAERFLDGFEGILQVDGYAGYNRLTGPKGQVRRAFCWSHARRKLHESFDSTKSEVAAEGLRRIAELYAIEAEIRGASPQRRLAERQARTAPLVEAFGVWLREQRARLSAKSRLGEKLAYIARHWDGLQMFLEDGRVEMDSNSVENLIRPVALNRKNALFAGHDEGASRVGTYCFTHRNSKDERCRTLCLSQDNPRSHRHGPPEQSPRRTPPLEFRKHVKLKSRCGADTAYLRRRYWQRFGGDELKKRSIEVKEIAILLASFSIRRLLKALHKYTQDDHTSSPARLFSGAAITPGSVDRTILLANIVHRMEAP